MIRLIVAKARDAGEMSQKFLRISLIEVFFNALSYFLICEEV